jgi:hypothetical protein
MARNNNVDKARAIEMRNKGFHLRDIAEELNCSYGWCKAHLKNTLCDKSGRPTAMSLDPAWKLWRSVMERATEAFQKKRAAYKGVTIHELFKDYNSFASWVRVQPGFGLPNFELDKDLLGKGSLVYGPETCVFVPHIINMLLVSGDKLSSLPRGVYYDTTKRRYIARVSRSNKFICLGSFTNPDDAFYLYKWAKEAIIRQEAEKYKESLCPRAYDALMTHEVKR